MTLISRPTSNTVEAEFDTHRERLRIALHKLHEEQQLYDGLTGAADRAAGERVDAQRDLARAQSALKEVRAREPGRLAYAYLNNQEELRVGFDISAAQAEMQHCRGTLEHAEEIENALSSEIAESEKRLQIREIPAQEALAAVVINDPQFNALFAARDAAWRRLRTLCIAFDEISNALGGYLPELVRTRFRASEPLEKG